MALLIWNPSGLSTIQEHPIKEYLSFQIHLHQHQHLSHSSRQITSSLTGSNQVLGPPTPKRDQGNGTFLKVCDQAVTTKFLYFLGKISCLGRWKSTGHSRRGRGNTVIGHRPLMILDGFIKQYVTRIFCVANIVTAHTGMRHCHGNPGHEVSNEKGQERESSSEGLMHSGSPGSHNNNANGSTAYTCEEANRAGYVRVHNGFHSLSYK